LLIVALVGVAHLFVAADVLRVLGASVVLAFALYKFVRRFAHPPWVGMRVHFRDLVAWSFLMSLGHGAGLMLLPLLMQGPLTEAASSQPLPENLAITSVGQSLAVVGIHTLAMLITMGVVAVLVFEKLGLAILRQAWINLDLVWAGALLVAGSLTLVVHH
ncbi:MAG: hypothetical protein M3120_09555, partial [Pseudomonadota bacterium]|nr:hypothetical protein [Pseudomonadota bacterium]